MDYIILISYFLIFTLILFIAGYNFFYNNRAVGAGLRLGIELPQSLKKFLDLTTIVAFIALLVVGFFLILSIFEAVNKF